METTLIANTTAAAAPDTTLAHVVSSNLAEAGAAWVMVVLAALLLAALVLISIRTWALVAARTDASQLGAELETVLKTGGLAGAQGWLAASPRLRRTMDGAVLGRLLDAGVPERGSHAAAHLLEVALGEARARHSRGLGLLTTIATDAFFVALFGTVVGVMVCFQALGGPSPGAGGGGILARLGPGISEALSTTAVGLVVAIVATVASTLLRQEVQRRVEAASRLGRIVLSYLPVMAEGAR